MAIHHQSIFRRVPSVGAGSWLTPDEHEHARTGPGAPDGRRGARGVPRCPGADDLRLAGGRYGPAAFKCGKRLKFAVSDVRTWLETRHEADR